MQWIGVEYLVVSCRHLQYCL